MSSEPDEQNDVRAGQVQEFSVTRENTFQFMPGPMTGISCPCCFHDQLLRDIIERGECRSCGADLQLSLTATQDGE
ncbi:hypothetical protein ACFR9U_18950 [Halorientalis brevis]|uniref:Uncharacterized protein n=1 Tax=Halorientalis brevis TaxID=1126241 RepID=A0ABD6CGU3_9EURY|nr:hypothetical protein [Halorientalis brevis]